jgi:hypothetical protein
MMQPSRLPIHGFRCGGDRGPRDETSSSRTRSVRPCFSPRWGNVPSAWGLTLWPLALALFGMELFTDATPRLDSSPLLLSAFIGFGLLQLALGIWAIVTSLQALAEVQGFSVWKALGNSITAALVIGIALFVVVGLMMLSSAW